MMKTKGSEELIVTAGISPHHALVHLGAEL